MPALVLLLPKTSYRADDLVAAAERAGAEVLIASDRCHVLAEEWPGAIPLEFARPEEAALVLAAAVRARAPVAVLGVDEETAVIAALTSAQLGLPHNPVAAVQATRNKALARALLLRAGVPVPWFEVVPREPGAAALDALCRRAPYPCVVKPLVLSGSRGVIRADDAPALRAALARTAALLRSPEVAVRRDPALGQLLVEEFLPGPEIALEGLLDEGRVRPLAVFDKPDPLDGPFFEETLYVTPSRHTAALQEAAWGSLQDAVRALGLRDGPLHAELRLTPRGPRVLEVAARSIGGLCGRVLRFGVGVSLEDLIVRHALASAAGTGLSLPAREGAAAGVMMLPIRRGGVLREVRGLPSARAVAGVTDVVITAHLDEELVPLPEGASYLGFAFARGETPAQVEAALREAEAHLEVRVSPKLAVARTV
ncbi:MAG: ATP-grasp domain-containing protein [Myxococcales bacterium]